MNIFEGTVEQPSITGYTSEVAKDTSVGDTINLVGSTIWETYKGAEIAKFKDNEVNEWNPQVLMGSKPDDPKQYGWSPELSDDLGLEQLQRGIDQGTLDVDQAEAMANAKFKELVNRLPAVTSEARQALNIWKMGHSSAGRSKGSSKPQNREEVMKQAELDNYKEYLESGFREAGYSEEYYLKMKGNKALTEAKEKLDVASGNAGKDTVANKTSLATLNYRVELGKLQQQYNNGVISETDFANMRRVEQVKAMNQYRIDVDTAIASNPAGASEMKEEMTRGLEEMKLMFEQQEQLSPEQQAATALETQVLLEKYNAHNNMAMARAANIFPAVVMEHLLKSATGTVQREYMQSITDNFETIMSENDALAATANKFMDNLLRSKAGASFTPRPDANPQTAAPFNKATMSNQDAKVGGPEQALNVMQMLSNLETDRYGMLAEALANKPTDYLMPADKKDITGTVNSFMHGISNVLHEAVRQYINDGGDLRRTLNSNFAGFKFRKETDRQLINLMRIMAKNPSLFGQAEYDMLVDQAAKTAIPDGLLDFYFQEAGIDYKREEPETKELPSLEPISMDLKPDSDINIDDIYNRLSQAETGNIKDRFIRTKVSGSSSSAYGPVQITRGLMRGVLAQAGDEFTPEEKEYMQRFIEQGNMFLKYGDEPTKEGYDTRYDYGGGGDLTSDEDRRLYESVAKKIIMMEYKAAGGTDEAFLKRWRFGPSSDKTVDAGYKKRFGIG